MTWNGVYGSFGLLLWRSYDSDLWRSNRYNNDKWQTLLGSCIYYIISVILLSSFVILPYTADIPEHEPESDDEEDDDDDDDEVIHFDFVFWEKLLLNMTFDFL